MPDLKQREEYQVVWLVRRLFRALAHKSDETLAELGISAADRAVMEFLYPEQALSVPEIARKYDVSRQHVQVTVNGLIGKRLLATGENPRHKRSPLVVLTRKGRQLFASILEKDREAIDVLFSGIPRNSIRVTRKTLQTLFEIIKED